MNDDFLHRLRKAPPPEFLEELKARLDRQSKLSRPRRSGFGRGLIVGFLVAGVAFAVTSVSLTGLPTSTAQFFSAPVQFFSRMMTGHGSADREANHPQIKAVPLSPWFQTPRTVAPASATDAPADASTSSTSAADHTEAQTGSSGGALASPLATVRIAAQREIYSIAQGALLNRMGTAKVSVKFVEEPAKTIFEGFCGTQLTTNAPDIIETTRRITADQNCLKERRKDIIEVKVGYQALILVRSKLYGPLNLSARDLFLALARQVPNPEQAGQLIDNPYTTWNQVDPALPYDSIHIYGPPRNSPEGKLVTELLLEAGCNTFPALTALRDRDATAFETTCHTLRTDKVYDEVSPGAFNYSVLSVSPTALGVASFNSLQWIRDSKDTLIVNPIDGIAPAHATLADRSYSASRTISLYTTRYNMDGTYWVGYVMSFLQTPSWSRFPYPATPWGLVDLDEPEHSMQLEILRTFKTVQF